MIRYDPTKLIEQLTQGIAELTTSDNWRHYLDTQARFHHYSPGNAMLIVQQYPYATQVAGYRTWQSMNRQVRKGEMSIRILAPLIGNKTDEETQEKSKAVRGFRCVPVFDVAQTEGALLPEICNKLQGADVNGYYSRLVFYAHSIGYQVEDYEFETGTNGDCNHSEHVIRVEARNDPAQRVKTLAHELAHAVLHNDRSNVNRELIELEAESTAYVVCAAIGIDTGDYSFGYVAGWAGGGDDAVKNIRASCARIQATAEGILQSVPAVEPVEPIPTVEPEPDVERQLIKPCPGNMAAPGQQMADSEPEPEPEPEIEFYR